VKVSVYAGLTLLHQHPGSALRPTSVFYPHRLLVGAAATKHQKQNKAGCNVLSGILMVTNVDKFRSVLSEQ